MRFNEYDTVQFAVKWMIENKAGNEIDITDAYMIEKITDACHGDLRKHCMSQGVANNGLRITNEEERSKWMDERMAKGYSFCYFKNKKRENVGIFCVETKEEFNYIFECAKNTEQPNKQKEATN